MVLTIPAKFSIPIIHMGMDIVLKFRSIINIPEANNGAQPLVAINNVEIPLFMTMVLIGNVENADVKSHILI